MDPMEEIRANARRLTSGQPPPTPQPVAQPVAQPLPSHDDLMGEIRRNARRSALEQSTAEAAANHEADEAEKFHFSFASPFHQEFWNRYANTLHDHFQPLHDPNTKWWQKVMTVAATPLAALATPIESMTMEHPDTSFTQTANKIANSLAGPWADSDWMGFGFIANHTPDWVKKAGRYGAVGAGLGVDMLADPLTYTTFGASRVAAEMEQINRATHPLTEAMRPVIKAASDIPKEEYRQFAKMSPEAMEHLAPQAVNRRFTSALRDTDLTYNPAERQILKDVHAHTQGGTSADYRQMVEAARPTAKAVGWNQYMPELGHQSWWDQFMSRTGRSLPREVTDATNGLNTAERAGHLAKFEANLAKTAWEGRAGVRLFGGKPFGVHIPDPISGIINTVKGALGKYGQLTAHLEPLTELEKTVQPSHAAALPQRLHASDTVLPLSQAVERYLRPRLGNAPLPANIYESAEYFRHQMLGADIGRDLDQARGNPMVYRYDDLRRWVTEEAQHLSPKDRANQFHDIHTFFKGMRKTLEDHPKTILPATHDMVVEADNAMAHMGADPKFWDRYLGHKLMAQPISRLAEHFEQVVAGVNDVQRELTAVQGQYNRIARSGKVTNEDRLNLLASARRLTSVFAKNQKPLMDAMQRMVNMHDTVIPYKFGVEHMQMLKRPVEQMNAMADVAAQLRIDIGKAVGRHDKGFSPFNAMARHGGGVDFWHPVLEQMEADMDPASRAMPHPGPGRMNATAADNAVKTIRARLAKIRADAGPTIDRSTETDLYKAEGLIDSLEHDPANLWKLGKVMERQGHLFSEHSMISRLLEEPIDLMGQLFARARQATRMSHELPIQMAMAEFGKHQAVYGPRWGWQYARTAKIFPGGQTLMDKLHDWRQTYYRAAGFGSQAHEKIMWHDNAHNIDRKAARDISSEYTIQLRDAINKLRGHSPDTEVPRATQLKVHQAVLDIIGNRIYHHDGGFSGPNVAWMNSHDALKEGGVVAKRALQIAMHDEAQGRQALQEVMGSAQAGEALYREAYKINEAFNERQALYDFKNGHKYIMRPGYVHHMLEGNRADELALYKWLSNDEFKHMGLTKSAEERLVPSHMAAEYTRRIQTRAEWKAILEKFEEERNGGTRAQIRDESGFIKDAPGLHNDLHLHDTMIGSWANRAFLSQRGASARRMIQDMQSVMPQHLMPMQYDDGSQLFAHSVAGESLSAAEIEKKLKDYAAERLAYGTKNGYRNLGELFPGLENWMVTDDLFDNFKQFGPRATEGAFGALDFMGKIAQQMNNSWKKFELMFTGRHATNIINLAYAVGTPLMPALKRMFDVFANAGKNIRKGFGTAAEEALSGPVHGMSRALEDDPLAGAMMEHGLVPFDSAGRGVTPAEAASNMLRHPLDWKNLKHWQGPMNSFIFDIMDTAVKMGTYEHFLNMGASPEYAAELTHLHTIDYAMRWMNPQLKAWGHALFPFFAWSAGNTMLHIPYALIDPRRYAIMREAENAVNHYMGSPKQTSDSAALGNYMMTNMQEMHPNGTLANIYLSLGAVWEPMFSSVRRIADNPLSMNTVYEPIRYAMNRTSAYPLKFPILSAMNYAKQRFQKNQSAAQEIGNEVLWGYLPYIHMFNALHNPSWNGTMNAVQGSMLRQFIDVKDVAPRAVKPMRDQL